jgi:site-specific recombinase XerD
MRRFLEFAGMSAREVLEARQSDLASQDLASRKRFENTTRMYLNRLEERGKGYSMRVIAYSALRSFFSTYGVELQMRRGDAPKGDYEREKRPFTRDEIRRVLAVSDLHERALFLFLKDTGLARSDVSKLRLRNIGEDISRRAGWREWLTVDNFPISIRARRTKTGEKFHSFIGGESIEALRVYFEHRERGTQHLDAWRRKRGVPPEKVTLDSLVFHCKKKVAPLSPQYITRLTWVKINQAGIKGAVSTHSFRHFFQSTLEDRDLAINPNWIRRMMGHKVRRRDVLSWKPSTNPAYSHPSDEQLSSAYEKAYPLLSVLPRHVDEERLRSLEKFREQASTREEEYAERVERLERMLDNAMVLLREKNKETEG